MVSKRWAVRVVERYLAEQALQPDAPALVVMEVRPHRLGWMIIAQGERYVRTHNIADMVVGHGFFLVDGVDAGLHTVHATADLEHGEWIDEYLEQVRGVERADPLRAEVAELLEREQRLEALRVVRATAPGLGPQGAKKYVEAVAAGIPIPEHIRPRSPRPTVRFELCRALTGPNPEPVV
ncbi:hypothetical protein [Nocardia sp. CA-290969]|uniref:hypothetical protein n=1 Tax=Nocardia sp. CA-290969 TaxID=3239986 RepID=UPI003D8AAA7C